MGFNGMRENGIKREQNWDTRDERTSKDNNGPCFWGADSVCNGLVVEVVVGEGYVDAGF